jgi:uncharacterized YigZ family protein
MKLFTVTARHGNELIVKKSRFIASLYPVQSERAVKEMLAEIKQKHRNATHHPYAYRIGYERINERSADDGEPPKSSGLPLLQELQNALLTNVLLAVTRYFGGIKLGLGGLSRAYRESALQVIMTAKKIPAIPLVRLEVSIPQEDAGRIRNLLERFNARIVEETYAENATYIVEIEKDTYPSCTEAINNMAKGKAIILRLPATEDH